MRVKNTELYSDEYEIPAGAKVLVKKDDVIEQGTILARVAELPSGEKAEDEAEKKPKAKSDWTNMKCAVGFCGHCQYGPNFICKDGPIFSYNQIHDWFIKREV